jgi:uncharacterized membrane protein YdjX (TVP38/TMEM64 family)
MIRVRGLIEHPRRNVGQRRENQAMPTATETPSIQPPPAGVWTRAGIVALGVGLVVAFYALGFDHYLSWDALEANLHEWRAIAQRHMPISVIVFFLAYVVVTSLSLPVAFFLSILGGALFDWWVGLGVCSLASTTGAIVAFLSSRYVLRDWVRRRFGPRLGPIDRGVERDGAWFLFSLRLTPLVPFFLINLGMGLTPMRLGTFAVVSWLGMLPVKAVLVLAGTTLGTIENPRDILSPGVLGTLAALGAAPLGMRLMVRAVGRRPGDGEGNP